MSYHLYISWLKGLRDTELNEEMAKVHSRYVTAQTKRSRGAWRKMRTIVYAEQKRRDEV